MAWSWSPTAVNALSDSGAEAEAASATNRNENRSRNTNNNNDNNNDDGNGMCMKGLLQYLSRYLLAYTHDTTQSMYQKCKKKPAMATMKKKTKKKKKESKNENENSRSGKSNTLRAAAAFFSSFRGNMRIYILMMEACAFASNGIAISETSLTSNPK